MNDIVGVGEIEGDLFATGEINVGGNATIGGDVEVSGDISNTGDVNVEGDIATNKVTARDDLVVFGESNLKNNVTISEGKSLSVGGSIVGSNKLSVYGSANISGNLNVTGDIDSNSDISCRAIEAGQSITGSSLFANESQIGDLETNEVVISNKFTGNEISKLTITPKYTGAVKTVEFNHSYKSTGNFTENNYIKFETTSAGANRLHSYQDTMIENKVFRVNDANGSAKITLKTDGEIECTKISCTNVFPTNVTATGTVSADKVVADEITLEDGVVTAKKFRLYGGGFSQTTNGQATGSFFGKTIRGYINFAGSTVSSDNASVLSIGSVYIPSGIPLVVLHIGTVEMYHRPNSGSALVGPFQYRLIVEGDPMAGTSTIKLQYRSTNGVDWQTANYFVLNYQITD